MGCQLAPEFYRWPDALMSRSRIGLASVCLLLMAQLLQGGSNADNWPQFRGPGGLGVADPSARPPLKFGPAESVFWKTSVPAGNSSPVIWGNRLFLTGFADGRLWVMALDRDTGRELWRQEVVPTQVEEVHRGLGSPASATPVTDGERVYVHFGSVGLLAYDLQGRELWRHPMKMTQTEYGASSSPVLVGENVIQLLDQDAHSHVLAVHRKTGKTIWQVDRPEMRRGFGTPVVWNHDGKTDLVVPGTLWMIGYHPATGEERWRVSGLARITCTSPVIGNGMLLAASWTTGGDRSADRISMPSFDEFAALYDANHDGKFSYSELPEGPAKQRFKHLDGNRNQLVEREEWESMAAIFSKVENQAFAVKPDGQGRISDAGVVWRFKKGLPYVASPVLYQGMFYLVKNGGFLTCLNPETGKPAYQEERLGPVGDYYASLLAANGRIYVVSQRGVVTVVKAGDAFEVLSRNDLGEVTQASPAALGDVLYLRTATQLYAFREATKAP